MTPSSAFSSAFGKGSGYGVLGEVPSFSTTPYNLVATDLSTIPGYSQIPQAFLDKSTGLSGTHAGGPLDRVFNPSGFGSLDFGQKAGMALTGLGTLGNLYAGFKQLSLANKQFQFQKEFANANLANQIKSYNTALEDRARARAAMEGQSPEQARAYVEQNKMTR